MKYIIHSNIEFDTKEYILTSLNDSNLSIKLSNSAGRILEELIKQRNTNLPITREHIFTVVWRAHGLESSHGNLNQQISLIRKTLTTLGLDIASIITIPKRGLKLNSQITIENIQDNSVTTNSSTNHTIDQHNSLSHSILLSFKTYVRYTITLMTMLIITFSMGLIFLYNKTDNVKLYCCKEINACNICTVPATSEFEYYDYNLPYFEIA